MLDPRIYRTGLMVVVIAVIVVAFSLGNQAPPLTATLVPDAFDGSDAYSTMQTLAQQYPNRPPGSPADNALADYVANAFRNDHFQVSQSVFTAQTVDGPRTLQTVTGTLDGASPGAIVIVADRDSVPARPRRPIWAAGAGAAGPASAPSELSGTAVLLELARDLSAQSQQRTVVVASTSGEIGAAGAQQLAQTLPGPVDAVIVLGDQAGTQVSSPIVVPWSDSQLVAPALLRNTVAAAISGQAGVTPTDESLGGQFLHLAFPLAVGEQRPFADSGEPAVLVSSSGARVPASDEPTSPAQIAGFGRGILEAVSALEAGPDMPPPSSYLRWDGKLIPAWAIRVLVLALIIPALLATIDGLARARRRGYRVGRWLPWVLSACVPFALAVLAVPALRMVGAIGAAPPGPVGGDAITLPARAVAILIGLACLIAVAFVARWRVGRHLWASQPGPAEPAPARSAPASGIARNGRAHRRRAALPGDAASPGAAAAFLLILCAVSLVLWVENPFAAGLVVPALNLWMWIVAPEQRPRLAWAVLLFAAGLVPAVLAAYYYASVLGLGPAPAAWNAVLMLAGGDFPLTVALLWSVVLGCVVSLAVIIVRMARQPRRAPEQSPITIRGPLTYAGVGGTRSSGTTRSALRR
jgi:hypothetical protein